MGKTVTLKDRLFYSRLLQDDPLKYFPWTRGVRDSEPIRNLKQSSHLPQKVHIDKLTLNQSNIVLIPQSCQWRLSQKEEFLKMSYILVFHAENTISLAWQLPQCCNNSSWEFHKATRLRRVTACSVRVYEGRNSKSDLIGCYRRREKLHKINHCSHSLQECCQRTSNHSNLAVSTELFIALNPSITLIWAPIPLTRMFKSRQHS